MTGQRKLSWKKKALLLGTGMLVCLVLMEAAARVLLGSGYPMNRPDPATARMRFLNLHFASRMLRRVSDPALCYELVPGGRAEIPGQVYTVNRDGFRGPAVPREKPTHTFRVAISGDSFVFGWGTGDDHTLPRYLERMLRGGGLGYDRFEVINGGVPGYNTAQMKELLLRKAFAFHPDLVVMVVSANDLTADYLHFDPLFQGLYTDFLPVPYAWKTVLWRLSVAYRFVSQRYKAWLEATGRVGALGPKEAAFFGRQVHAAAAEAKKRGIAFLAVILPMLEPFDHYPYAAQHEAMHKALKGVDYVDLLPAMQGFDVKALWFRPEDHHLNARANRAVARLVLRELAARGLVRIRPGTLPADPLADPLWRSGDLVVVDMDADPGHGGGFPGALFRVTRDGKTVVPVCADPAFREPVDLAFEPTGDLLVLDNAADPLHKGYTGALFRVDRFTGRASCLLSAPEFVLPDGLYRDGDGTIYISEKEADPKGLGTDTGCLFAFDSAKRELRVLAADAAFRAPGAVGPGPGGTLLLLDADANPRDYKGRDGRRGTPGVLFQVDKETGAVARLIVFKDTVSPVGLVPRPDGRLFIIDANADVLHPSAWLGGIVEADPREGTYRFIFLSKRFVDPTRGDLGPDGALYFTDSNADPLGLGPDRAGKGVQGTGPGAVWRLDTGKKVLSLVYSGKAFVNPIALKVVPRENDW